MCIARQKYGYSGLRHLSIHERRIAFQLKKEITFYFDQITLDSGYILLPHLAYIANERNFSFSKIKENT